MKNIGFHMTGTVLNVASNNASIYIVCVQDGLRHGSPICGAWPHL